MANFFKVLHHSKKSKARVGQIKTSHGIIKTPAFVPVATKGTVKALPPQFVQEIGIQVAFVNTYHLVTHPGGAVIEKAGGIHNYSGLNIPLMSDSGGFQVFSLARKNKFQITNSKKQKNSKSQISISKQSNDFREVEMKSFGREAKMTNQGLLKRIVDIRGEEQPILVKITDEGVKFRSTYDGKVIEFTPEKSIEYQRMIGADINMAFDECTYYPATHNYANKAMERTHRWLKRCIDYKRNFQFSVFSFQSNKKFLNIKNLKTKKLLKNEKLKMKNIQYIYGIIQGGLYEDLRKKSAEFVVNQPVDGVAIGGVSVGETKKEMRDQVRWVADYLPKDKPVHLLGVGQADDIIDLVRYGIDTFDCVEPTRLARMGKVYQWERILSRLSLPPVLATSGRLEKSLRAVGSPSSRAIRSRPDFETDIFKGIYKNDLSPVDNDCNCYVCRNFTKSYLHHLFKQREILGYNLATYHNLWVMERLFEKIREGISKDSI